MHNKQRIYSFDFIRALCAVGIIVFHFSCEMGQNDLFHPFYSFANGGWGEIFVGIFFILSGATLYYNNSEIKSLRTFYRKRIKSIYPMFYIAYLVFYIWSAVATRNPFYAGNPLKLLLSAAGIDGYFQYRMVNYYQVGEWFLGAIIMLYVLYPLLLKVFKKSALLLTLICTALYGLVFIPNFWTIPSSFNFFACLISFELGMLLMKYKEKWYDHTIIFVISTIASLVLIFIPIENIPNNLLCHILPVTLFISLSYLGALLMKVKMFQIVFSELSLISFAVFLLQHKVINMMLRVYSPTNNLVMLLWLLLIVSITIASAKLLYIVNKRLLRSRLFKRIELKTI